MTVSRLARCAACLLFVSLVAPPSVLAGREELSEACEISVALSAAPSRLRADATVYALVDGDYRKLVDGDGILTCVVERNHVDSLIPQCMDRAGVDSVLPAILARSRLSIAGATFEQINTASEARLEAGDFTAPARPGVNYMMSDYNYIYVPSAQRVLKVPPHVMFYAPNLHNADIGGSFESLTSNIGTPFVFSEGPHGYIIVYTQYSAQADDVADACAGELGEAPPRFDPFPKD